MFVKHGKANMRSVGSRMAIRTRTVNWVIGINTTTIIIICHHHHHNDCPRPYHNNHCPHHHNMCGLGRRGNKKADNELGKKQAFG